MMHKIYDGIFNQTIFKKDDIKFVILKEYTVIKNNSYCLLEISSPQKDLILIRKPCDGELRRYFKYSNIIDYSSDFFIFIAKVTSEIEADTFIKKMLIYKSNKLKGVVGGT